MAIAMAITPKTNSTITTLFMFNSSILTNFRKICNIAIATAKNSIMSINLNTKSPRANIILSAMPKVPPIPEHITKTKYNKFRMERKQVSIFLSIVFFILAPKTVFRRLEYLFQAS